MFNMFGKEPDQSNKAEWDAFQKVVKITARFRKLMDENDSYATDAANLQKDIDRNKKSRLSGLENGIFKPGDIHDRILQAQIHTMQTQLWSTTQKLEELQKQANICYRERDQALREWHSVMTAEVKPEKNVHPLDEPMSREESEESPAKKSRME